MDKPANVDHFIANAPHESRSILIELREMIQSAFTGIEEKIGYGVPQYKQGNTHLGLSTAKKHVTLGFDYGVISDEARKQLENQGYKLGLQTLQIKFTQDVPKAEIQGIFEKILQNGQ